MTFYGFSSFSCIFLFSFAQNLAFASLLSVAAQFGMQFWVAFWAGPTMIYNLEKPTFAAIQSKLFPKFGLVGVSTSIIAMAGHYFNSRGTSISHPIHVFGIRWSEIRLVFL